MKDYQPPLFSTPEVESILPPVTEGLKPVLVLEVPVRLPSWNEILGMEQWARYKYKQQLADEFLSALRLTARDSSMRTTCAKNTWLTYCATLESYLAMRQAKRRSRLAKKRLDRRNLSESSSPSSNSKVPF